MRNLIRKPITWMVVAEVVVVTALAAISWQLIAAPRGAHLPALVLPVASPQAGGADEVPAGAVAPPSPSPIPLLPGLNVDPGFWQQRLEALNGAQAQFEAMEWRLVSSAVDSVERYLKQVVLPSLERAESGTGRKV